MELKNIKGSVYCIPGSTNVGVIKINEQSAILIDSGIDDEYGKKIVNLLFNNGLAISAIINTHSHADHCGGNNYIKAKTGCKIFASELESSIIESPFLEPFYLFSGAAPLEELKNKFLMAKPSNVDYVIKKGEPRIKINGLELGVIELPGHSPNQIGVEYEGVIFCADALFSEEIINKYKVLFFTDIGKQRETLNLFKEKEYSFYIPAHAEPAKSITRLLEANINSIDKVERYFSQSILTNKKTTEQAFQEMCKGFELSIIGIQQYHLMKTVVLAYLSNLHKKGIVKTSVEDNILYWKR